MSSDDYQDASDASYDDPDYYDSSGTTDYEVTEFLALADKKDYNGNEKKKYAQNLINVKAKGGIVVVGDRATVRMSPGNGSGNHAGAKASTSERNTEPAMQENRHSNDVSSQINLVYAKTTPGSYCHHNYYQQTNVGDWNPEPIDGILIQEGEIDFEWTVEFFLQNPEKFIQEMDTCAGSQREKREQFILLGIFPYLENVMWGKSSVNNVDTYNILALASCSRSCPDVVKQSLYQFQHLLYRDNLDNFRQNLLGVEKIMRSSIVSEDGVFREEADTPRLLRLAVYSRFLSELIIHQIHSEFSRTDLKNVVRKFKKLKGLFNNTSLKSQSQYLIDFILIAISYLSKSSPRQRQRERLGGYLEECKTVCANRLIKDIEEKGLLFFQNLMGSNVEWFDLHCILHYLHGKVHTERPTPQSHKERGAMILLRCAVKVHLEGRGGDDWKFCLLAGSLMSEISMNDVIKDVRIIAGSCLEDLLGNENVQKRPECRAIVGRLSKRVLFCNDSLIKRLLVHHLLNNQNAQYRLPAELHIEHLIACYKTQTLEVNGSIVSESRQELSKSFVHGGALKGQKVVVKILVVNKQDILAENPAVQSEAKKRFIAEAYNLRQLNRFNQHPNIQHLLAYNTTTLPFHIITQYEKYGDLLQLVRSSREVQPLSSSVVYKMFISIIEGLLYLQQKLHLVHRAIMAENILVGDGYTCKLTGLHSLGKLQHKRHRDAEDNLSQEYLYAEDDDYFPVCISGNDGGLPVRWKAPECLRQHSYSASSDVWAFGVLMYEVLTLGCYPYRWIPKDDEVAEHVLNKADEEVLVHERSIYDDEYKLMKQCWKRQRKERITLVVLEEKLKEMRLQMRSGKEKPRPDPPNLESDTVDDSQQPQELNESVGVYDYIPDQDPQQPQELDEKEYATISDQDPQQPQELDEVEYATISEHTDAVVNRSSGIYECEAMDPCQPQGFYESVYDHIPDQDPEQAQKLDEIKYDNISDYSVAEDRSSAIYDVHEEELSPTATFSNLKEYVLSRSCEEDDIIKYLCQVASGLHDLHVNHIVHGDLRAEHVHLIERDKVQVGRLDRSRNIKMSPDEDISTSCVVKDSMPPGSTRWSAPEVILDGHYTYTSDVWAFGILAWELYASFTAGEDDKRSLSVPFHDLENREIPSHIRNHGPLSRPESCPFWVYIIMHQCWAFDPVQRPTALAILDCLKSRKPLESWTMAFWQANSQAYHSKGN